MNDFVQIRGYAAPYNRTIMYGENWQRIAPGAFTAMLRQLPDIKLQWGSHEPDAECLASVKSGGVEFFEDDFGLGFSFVLNLMKHRGQVAAITRRDRPADQCSVNMIVTNATDETIFGSGHCNVIRAATIDHVAVGLTNAAYRDTGVWPTHCALDEAPWRIRELAARWREGRAASVVRPLQQVVRSSQALLPAALAAFMAPRLKHYACVRREWASAFTKGKGVALHGAPMAHAAFSRAAGFTGDLKALIRSARADR
jgi:hypothetical protein